MLVFAQIICTIVFGVENHLFIVHYHEYLQNYFCRLLHDNNMFLISGLFQPMSYRRTIASAGRAPLRFPPSVEGSVGPPDVGFQSSTSASVPHSSLVHRSHDEIRLLWSWAMEIDGLHWFILYETYFITYLNVLIFLRVSQSLHTFMGLRTNKLMTCGSRPCMWIAGSCRANG